MRATYLIFLFATSCFAKGRPPALKAPEPGPYSTEQSCRAAKGIWNSAGRGSCTGAKLGVAKPPDKGEP